MIKNINANDCFKALKESDNSKLIDVRTNFEWKNNGYADLTSINQKINFNLHYYASYLTKIFYRVLF